MKKIVLIIAINAIALGLWLILIPAPAFSAPEFRYDATEWVCDIPAPPGLTYTRGECYPCTNGQWTSCEDWACTLCARTVYIF